MKIALTKNGALVMRLAPEDPLEEHFIQRMAELSEAGATTRIVRDGNDFVVEVADK